MEYLSPRGRELARPGLRRDACSYQRRFHSGFWRPLRVGIHQSIGNDAIGPIGAAVFDTSDSLSRKCREAQRDNPAMATLSFPASPDGLIVPVVVGLKAEIIVDLIANGLPIPSPIQCNA